MNFRQLISSSAPQDGGQVNQATFRLDVQVLVLALPQVFDAQIIQPRVAFDDGFGAFSFWLNGGLASRALSKTRKFFNRCGFWKS
jgi:hypothetical protein